MHKRRDTPAAIKQISIEGILQMKIRVTILRVSILACHGRDEMRLKTNPNALNYKNANNTASRTLVVKIC